MQTVFLLFFMKNACVFQSENVRWVHSVAQYREQESTLCGDVLLTAAFISYAGSFSKRYRHELLHNLWMPYLRTQKVCLQLKLFVLSIDIVSSCAKIVYCFICDVQKPQMYSLHSVLFQLLK